MINCSDLILHTAYETLSNAGACAREDRWTAEAYWTLYCTAHRLHRHQLRRRHLLICLMVRRLSSKMYPSAT